MAQFVLELPQELRERIEVRSSNCFCCKLNSRIKERNNSRRNQQSI